MSTANTYVTLDYFKRNMENYSSILKNIFGGKIKENPYNEDGLVYKLDIYDNSNNNKILFTTPNLIGAKISGDLELDFCTSEDIYEFFNNQEENEDEEVNIDG